MGEVFRAWPSMWCESSTVVAYFQTNCRSNMQLSDNKRTPRKICDWGSTCGVVSFSTSDWQFWREHLHYVSSDRQLHGVPFLSDSDLWEKLRFRIGVKNLPQIKNKPLTLSQRPTHISDTSFRHRLDITFPLVFNLFFLASPPHSNLCLSPSLCGSLPPSSPL